MSTTLVVLLIGLAVAALLVAVAARRGRHALVDPVDPDVAEHWLVDRAADRPRLQRLLRRADHRVAGGVAVAVGFALVFVAAVVVGWIFDSVDSGGGFARWDDAGVGWGPDPDDETTTRILDVLTHLGATWVLAILMTVVAIVDWRRYRQASVFGFLAVVGAGVSLINNGLKWIVMRDRPSTGLMVDAAGSSFPSGHSAAAAACWLAMAIVVGRWVAPRSRVWVTAAAIAIAVMVAATRVLLSVHWLTDVIAGLIVGWTWCFLVAIVFGGHLQRFGDPAIEIAEEATTHDAASGTPDPDAHGVDRADRHTNGARHG
jgi:membrane-associated phospholipid phosphatase